MAIHDAIEGDWESAIGTGLGAVLGLKNLRGAADDAARSLAKNQQLEFTFVDEFIAGASRVRNTQYRNTFFAAHPHLRGKVIVHHAI